MFYSCLREINFSLKLIVQLNEYNFFFLYEINQVLFFIWLRKDSSLIEDCVYLFRINFFLLLSRLLILHNLYSLLIYYQINQKKKKKRKKSQNDSPLSIRYISLFLIQRWKEEENCTCVCCTACNLPNKTTQSSKNMLQVALLNFDSQNYWALQPSQLLY